jgi:hypothetical protein
VPQSLELECDRLSNVVDGIQFKRLQWERDIGPALARLVASAHAALEKRSEFELAEEGATRDVKRFVLKVHGVRILAVTFRVEGGRVVVEGQAVDRGRYALANGAPLSAALDEADGPWMAGALQELFSRVQA